MPTETIYMIEIRKNTEEFEIVIVSPNEIKIDKIKNKLN